MGASWRLDKQRRPKGTYYTLVIGSRDTRRAVSLGYVVEAAADAARRALQAEQDAGTVGRVLALHETDPEAVIAYLTGDQELELELGPDYASMTLAEYHAVVYAPHRREARPRSWPSEEGHWRRILRELGALPLRKVDAHAVADYLDALRLERDRQGRIGQPASGATKRLHRTAIAALLKVAYRKRHLAVLPDLAVFRIEGSTKPVTPREVPLELAELAALLSAEPDPKHRAMWAVGAGQGLRPGELQRIRWEHVDWTDRTLEISGTKTAASAAEVPLTPIAFDELRAWWVRCGQPTEGVVFWGRAPGEPYLSVSGYKGALARAAVRARIDRPVFPYLLRASFVTIAWSLGVEKDVTRRIGRWTDEKMLDDVYCRPRPKDLVARVAAFTLPVGS